METEAEQRETRDTETEGQGAMRPGRGEEWGTTVPREREAPLGHATIAGTAGVQPPLKKAV